MTAYEEGVKARVCGKSLKLANPYMIGALEFYQWREGWKGVVKDDDCKNGGRNE